MNTPPSIAKESRFDWPLCHDAENFVLHRLQAFAGQNRFCRRLEERMATKSELRRLEEKMEAGFTAVRGDIERVSLRLDTIERALSTRLSQIETEVSRLRSVLYLLVKDQPELLRLLGSDPPLV